MKSHKTSNKKTIMMNRMIRKKKKLSIRMKALLD